MAWFQKYIALNPPIMTRTGSTMTIRRRTAMAIATTHPTMAIHSTTGVTYAPRLRSRILHVASIRDRAVDREHLERTHPRPDEVGVPRQQQNENGSDDQGRR